MDVAKDIQKIDMGVPIDAAFDDDDDAPVSRVPKAASYDSIAKQSKNSVMQFPLLASKSLSFENMQMMSKACERNYASFLQTLFTMNMITSADTPQELVRQFHQNSNNTVKGPGDVFTFIFNSAIPEKDMNVILENIRYGNFTVEEVFNTKPVNQYYMPKSIDELATATEARGNVKINVGTAGSDNKITGLPKNPYLDSDAKKSNEMMPTMLQVRMFRDMGNGKGEYIDFIVGVKATIHPISSEDMINHLVNVFQDRGSLFKFITWTTGEISFFKDLVLNIPSIKEEIKGIRSGKSSKWWSALKNLKAKRRLNKLTLREPILPNASLIISQDEVEYIKANYGFDIMNEEEAAGLIKKLNILAFYVVDSASEVVYSFVDGNDDYSVNTFRALERENGNAERQFKDMLKAVNRL